MKLTFRLLATIALVCTVTLLQSQSRSITGIVNEVDAAQALPGVNVAVLQLADSAIIAGTTTLLDGSFQVSGLPAASVLIRFGYVGYETAFKLVDLTEQSVNMGEISLLQSAVSLDAFSVEETVIQSTQRGDTTEYNADAFKVNVDATTEDLMRKMPGVTIEDGQVQAQGEQVKRVLVDGKPFFGEDARATLRNMPAEAVEKVQVSDFKSDQSQFTGFDDGEEGKTINIVTKPEFRNGTFGRFYAGYGDAERYKAGGNINFFNDARRISLLFQANNINQQNFSSEDLSGVAGASGSSGRGRRGMRGGSTGNFTVGARDGIAQTIAGGINYSDQWGKKVKVSGSYFYNRTDRNVQNELRRSFVQDDSEGLTYSEFETISELSDQHRINMRIEYKPDSMNTILFTPSASYSSVKGESTLIGENADASEILNDVGRGFNTTLQTLNFSAPVLLQHKFRKARRTVSLELTPAYNSGAGQSRLLSENRFFEDSLFVDSLDQEGELDLTGYSAGASLAYTEPVGEKGMLQFNWRPNYSYSDSRNETFSFNPVSSEYDLRDSLLNNVFESTYHTQLIGTEYSHNWKKLQVNFGLSYQWAELSAVQQFPVQLSGLQNFSAVLPNARIAYRFSKSKNFRLFYRARNNPPAIEQLQNVVNNSNPVRLTIGNPDLKQDYRHMMFMRYSASNPEKSTTFFVGGGFTFTNNYIGDATTIALSDTTLADGIRLARGGQLVQPVNLDGQLSIRTFASYGIPVKPIKSNLNINLSLRLSSTPGLINGELNRSNTPSAGFGLTLASNISKSIDFTISSNTSWNYFFNTLQTNLNSQNWNQSSRADLTWSVWKGLILNISANHQYFTGLSEGFDQNFVLVNGGLGYKFLKERRAELRLEVFDLLNQNVSVQRVFSDVYIEDREVNVLQRFVMLTFTYNLRNFVSAEPEKPFYMR